MNKMNRPRNADRRRRIAMNASRVHSILNNPDARVYHYHDVTDTRIFINSILTAIPDVFHIDSTIYSTQGPFRIVLSRDNYMRAIVNLHDGDRVLFEGKVYTIGEVKWIFQRCFELPQK